MKALLSNMGFVLQISGIFVLLPIIVALYFNEMNAVIALFMVAIAFLALGFFLNALCERKELSYKESCALIVLVFVVLSLIGAIPYMYIDVSNTGDIARNTTDSIFESASGFTTTGFSVIPNVTALPKSIILYRALTQFVGGIGIVLVLLAFFYPEAKLKDFSRSLGLEKNQKIKKTFYLIISVYCAFTVIMILAGLISGFHDVVSLASFIFAALSTGGFAALSDIKEVATNPPLNFILIISMILGATNFIVLAGLFKKRFKEFLFSEFSVFIILAVFSIGLVTILFGHPIFDSAFHVISAMSTTGFGYLSAEAYTDGFKLFLVFLMFIGGASFSTAGGIKIFRLILLFKAVKKAIVDSITEEDSKITLFGKEYTNTEVIQSIALVFSMAAIIIFSSFIITTYGYSPIDSIFETTSAVATTGLSYGAIVTPTLALELKWLFTVLMIVGRVEIFAILIMFSRAKEK